MGLLILKGQCPTPGGVLFLLHERKQRCGAAALHLLRHLAHRACRQFLCCCCCCCCSSAGRRGSALQSSSPLLPDLQASLLSLQVPYMHATDDIMQLLPPGCRSRPMHLIHLHLCFWAPPPHRVEARVTSHYYCRPHLWRGRAIPARPVPRPLHAGAGDAEGGGQSAVAGHACACAASGSAASIGGSGSVEACHHQAGLSQVRLG